LVCCLDFQRWRVQLWHVRIMKTLSILAIVVTSTLFAGCGFSPTKVTTLVIEHKQEAGGKYYALLCEVLEPTNLTGSYHIAATQRSDLVTNVDGAEFEIYLNYTMVGSLLPNKPLDYDVSPPSPGSGDFLDSAKRIK
jgi:hypothetical protein